MFVAPGPGGHDANAHAAGRPGIAGGHEGGALLVRGHDERNRRLAGLAVLLVIEEYGVVGRQDGPAAVPENRGNPFIRQYLHDHPGAGHLLAGKRMPEGAGLNYRVTHDALFN